MIDDGVELKKKRFLVKKQRGRAWCIPWGSPILGAREWNPACCLIMNISTFPSTTSSHSLLPAFLLHQPLPRTPVVLSGASDFGKIPPGSSVPTSLLTLSWNRFFALILIGDLAPGSHHLVSKGASAQPARPLHIPATIGSTAGWLSPNLNSALRNEGTPGSALM